MSWSGLQWVQSCSMWWPQRLWLTETLRTMLFLMARFTGRYSGDQSLSPLDGLDWFRLVISGLIVYWYEAVKTILTVFRPIGLVSSLTRNISQEWKIIWVRVCVWGWPGILQDIPEASEQLRRGGTEASSLTVSNLWQHVSHWTQVLTIFIVYYNYIMIHIYIRFPPSDLPMVVPPLPWLSPVINKSWNNFLTNNFDQDTGGFLTKKTRLVRIPESSFTDHDQLLEDLPQVTDQSELSI